MARRRTPKREPTADDEPLPPLPLEGAGPLSGRRAAYVAIVVALAAAGRVAIAIASRENEAPPAPSTMVIDDPGAGLSPAERSELDEAIRHGRPLRLDSDGHLHPAE